MEQILTYGLRLAGLVSLLIFGAFGWISYKEKEVRATWISLAIVVCSFIAFWGLSYTPGPVKIAAGGVLIGAFFLILFLCLLPIGQVEMGVDTPRLQYDERDVIFARANLEPGSPEYKSYYSMRPQNKSVDDRARAKPGLLSPQAKFGNPFLFASSDGSFGLTEALREAVNGPVSEQNYELPQDKMSAYIKNLAIYFGALDVGITELKPYHVYSHIGRGSGVYGDPIHLDHKFAIAFTVEMDFEMVSTGPGSPVVMESAKQYVEAARVAVQLANTIRNLGYPARAHIDGNYRVICPLVARDAGLGELGRMGLLMTPKLGPRVRLGVVTTNADLDTDERKPDPTVIDFCNICTKCAESCPSKSISFEERQDMDDCLRWKINAETCFHYWNVVGTDCARCMAVCPYSHADTFSHNLVRWGNARSGFFRRAANWMDDLFYGKKPPVKEVPKWTRVP